MNGEKKKARRKRANNIKRLRSFFSSLGANNQLSERISLKYDLLKAMNEGPPGVLSIRGLHGEAPYERITFFRLQAHLYENVRISLVEVYKTESREICHCGLSKGPKRTNRCILWL